MKTPTELLSTGEAAAILGVHRATVQRWVEQGKLEAWLVMGGAYGFRPDDIHQLAERMKRAG